MIAYKKCLELQFPGQIIGAGELERSLCRDINGHQVGQAGVILAGVVGISHDEKD
jgi:hypothetical protein